MASRSVFGGFASRRLTDTRSSAQLRRREHARGCRRALFLGMQRDNEHPVSPEMQWFASLNRHCDHPRRLRRPTSFWNAVRRSCSGHAPHEAIGRRGRSRGSHPTIAKCTGGLQKPQHRLGWRVRMRGADRRPCTNRAAVLLEVLLTPMRDAEGPGAQLFSMFRRRPSSQNSARLEHVVSVQWLFPAGVISSATFW